MNGCPTYLLVKDTVVLIDVRNVTFVLVGPLSRKLAFLVDARPTSKFGARLLYGQHVLYVDFADYSIYSIL